MICKSDEKIEDGKEYLCRELGKLNKKVNISVGRSYLLNELQWNNKILHPITNIEVLFISFLFLIFFIKYFYIKIYNIKSVKKYVEEEKKAFNPDVLKVKSPAKYLTLMTEAYYHMFADLFDKISIVHKMN